MRKILSALRWARKVKKRTLTNLSRWPDKLVDGLCILLKGGVVFPSFSEAFTTLRSRLHGHVAAVPGTTRRLGLEKLLDRRRSRERSLAAAMILARILDPRSKLATARCLRTETLSEEPGVEDAREDELYRTTGLCSGARTASSAISQPGTWKTAPWCSPRSPRSTSRARGAHRHRSALSRDGKGGTRQTVFALLYNRDGSPLAADVLAGPTPVQAEASRLLRFQPRNAASSIYAATVAI